MATVFVTGATGLVGANLCQALRARGDTVRALVRGDAAIAGAERVNGDVTDAAALRRGAAGADAVVHCAAILGGVAGRSAAQEYDDVNLGGTVNVLDTADPGARVVVLSTIAALQTPDVPVSETSPIPDGIPDESPYTRSKRLALLETERRGAAGADVCAVVPGGIYGPSPAVARALAPTSFNHDVQRALRREVARYAQVPLGWSYAADVVDVILRAIDGGRSGGRYLAMAAPEEAMTVGAFLTRACRLAGIDHVVADAPPTDDPAYDAEFAGMARIARRRFPTPLYDNAATCAELGFTPTPVDTGLAATIAWLPSA
jgi:dihydroflavonol-4-reductase